MPRTSIPVTEVGFLTEVDNLTWTTPDQANGNMFPNDGMTVLVIRNTTVGVITATVVSVPDEWGRTGDLSVAVPANTGVAFVPPLAPAVFNQRAADLGNVYVNWSAAGAQIAALRIRTN